MPLEIKTLRLQLSEVKSNLSSKERSELLSEIPKILSAEVVENLPPYFHEISSYEQAELWLSKMMDESCLFIARLHDQNNIIGFVFVSESEDGAAHIGYLLAREHWGKGLASELLEGFILNMSKTEPWTKLIGGVDRSNIASAHLLKKLGFVEAEGADESVVFYELAIK